MHLHIVGLLLHPSLNLKESFESNFLFELGVRGLDTFALSSEDTTEARQGKQVSG